jgi:hypothetical protein
MNSRESVGLASLDPPYSFIQTQTLIGPGSVAGFSGRDGQEGSHPDRIAVILSAAEDLRRAAKQGRFFAALGMTG